MSFKKITVIGGAGFLGTNLCQFLQDRGENFEILDIKQSRRFPGQSKIADVTSVDSLRGSITGDIVVLLAAVHRDDIKDVSAYHRVNVLGAKNVAMVCTEKKIKRILFTSSVAVYGLNDRVFDETDAVRPFNEYGKTKWEAEVQLQRWQSQTGNMLTVVRPTVIFGPGNRGNVYNLINSIASGRFIMIGKGENRKSMAYVDNIVAFLAMCLNNMNGYQLFNYSDSPDLQMKELVSLIRTELIGKSNVGVTLPYYVGIAAGITADFFSRMSNITLPISSIRVKKFCASTQITSKWEESTDFSPPIDLSKAIIKTVRAEFGGGERVSEIFYTE